MKPIWLTILVLAIALSQIPSAHGVDLPELKNKLSSAAKNNDCSSFMSGFQGPCSQVSADYKGLTRALCVDKYTNPNSDQLKFSAKAEEDKQTIDTCLKVATTIMEKYKSNRSSEGWCKSHNCMQEDKQCLELNQISSAWPKSNPFEGANCELTDEQREKMSCADRGSVWDDQESTCSQ